MSFNFDGVDEHIYWSSVQNLAASPFTLSLWVYWDADNLVNQIEYFFNIQNGTDTGRVIYLISWMNTGVSRALWCRRVGTTDLYRYTAGNAFPASQWVNMILTHTGTITDYTTAHIYANGTEVTYTVNQNGATETAPTGKWVLGGRTYDNTCVLDGKLAEVGVWDRVLNSTEISNLAGGKAPSLVPTDLIFYFSGKSDTLVAEVGGTGNAVGGAAYNASHPTMDYGECVNVIIATTPVVVVDWCEP